MSLQFYRYCYVRTQKCLANLFGVHTHKRVLTNEFVKTHDGTELVNLSKPYANPNAHAEFSPTYSTYRKYYCREKLRQWRNYFRLTV